MEFLNILYTIIDRIAVITINRPDKMNALNIETISEIGDAVHWAVADGDVGVIILTGTGAKAFVAGADISEFASFTPSQGKEMAEKGHRVFDSIENSPKPVIAAINGFALGGGCELAMSCHIRIASENAKFGQPEINLGIIPGYGGTQRLTRLVGRSKATHLLLTGDMISAGEAKSLGLVSEVTSPDALLDKAREIALKILQKSPVAAKRILELVNAYYDKKRDGFSEEIAEFGHSFATEDFKEGVSAFLEKRKPAFPGK